MYNPTQRLMRSRNDKIIAGVASGIGQYLSIDPVFVRLAFVAVAITGIGILLYPILWLIMPIDGNQSANPSQAVDEMRQQAMRVGEDIREVFVAPGSTPRQSRFDPMTGEPVDPDSEIPVNNLNNDQASEQPQSKRGHFLGIVLLGLGLFILISSLIPNVSTFVFPAILIALGMLFLQQSKT